MEFYSYTNFDVKESSFVFLWRLWKCVCKVTSQSYRMLDNNLWNHRHTGPVSLGGGGGCGLLPEYFLQKLAPKSSGFARILLVFCPKKATWQIRGGLQPSAPPPPPPSLVRLCVEWRIWQTLKTRTTVLPYSDERKQLLKIKFLANEQNVSVMCTLTSMQYHDVLT